MKKKTIQEPDNRPEKGIVKRVLNASLGVIGITFIAGMITWAGFNSALKWTNTESFCTSCHEMSINYDEYKGTVHYTNRTGVRATCADCHVPKQFWPKIAAKIRASKDVYHHLLGTIGTPEKYEERRLHMAEAVWDKMKNTDSRECRYCHDVKSMALDEQQGRAARKHKKMEKSGETCIDCHKGVAHELPEDYDET